jgi:hypothetical protein
MYFRAYDVSLITALGWLHKLQMLKMNANYGKSTEVFVTVLEEPLKVENIYQSSWKTYICAALE